MMIAFFSSRMYLATTGSGNSGYFFLSAHHGRRDVVACCSRRIFVSLRRADDHFISETLDAQTFRKIPQIFQRKNEKDPKHNN